MAGLEPINIIEILETINFCGKNAPQIPFIQNLLLMVFPSIYPQSI